MMNTSIINIKMPDKHKDILNHVLNKIIGNSHVYSIYLFGSCAKGTATEKSDIDIFVVTDSHIIDDTHPAFDAIYGAADDIPLENYISCDILTASKEAFDKDASHLITVVKRKGIKLWDTMKMV